VQLVYVLRIVLPSPAPEVSKAWIATIMSTSFKKANPSFSCISETLCNYPDSAICSVPRFFVRNFDVLLIVAKRETEIIPNTYHTAFFQDPEDYR